MSRYRRYRRRNPLFSQFYLSASSQYMLTIISAVALAGFIFSGFLLFRYVDTEDLIARGKEQIKEGKVALAANTFKSLVNRYPKSYEGHLLLGESYLQLGDRRQAEQEYRLAASLRDKNAVEHGADIALSKLAMAQKDYVRAENMIQDVLSKKPEERKKQLKDPEIQEALFSLYNSWGDYLMEGDNPNYAEAIERYDRALDFVNTFDQEENLKTKLVEMIAHYTGDLKNNNDYAKAIPLLRKSLKYRYQPDTLIEIAYAYEKLNELDKAIAWYRKAFEVAPNNISIRFANVLMAKGRQLLNEKKTTEAQQFFDEADGIGKLANLPMEMLYPVKLEKVQLVSKLDADTGEFEPTVNVRFANEASRPLHFLVAKATFLSGDKILGETTEAVATPDKVLAEAGNPKSKCDVVLKLKKSLNTIMLQNNHMQVKVSVAYSEGENQTWKVKAMQEASIRRQPKAEPRPLEVVPAGGQETAPRPLKPLLPQPDQPLPPAGDRNGETGHLPGTANHA
ncbi:MAG: tetratricopeptide repeat protein [Candidatus Melainabacteria bacterium]